MIYLDHNATSPLLPEVLEAMRPWLGVPANPASAHQFGQRATVAVERAREQVAALVGGKREGVVFTSGATEANHTALRGAAPSSLALSRIEHPCVIAAAELLSGQGTELRWLGVHPSGEVDLDEIPEVELLVLMAANHETGVIQPVQRALDGSIAVHVDATQAAGRIPLELGRAASVVLSSHKLGGPSGVGALVLPGADPFPALLTGGSQERGRRAGTVNVAGAVGFGVACELARTELDARIRRWTDNRDRLEGAIRSLGGRIIGSHRVGNTTCCGFAGIDGELLVQVLDLAGIAVSHGAACASGSLEPSPVLVAMGDPDPAGALRISQGPSTTPAEIDAAIAALTQAVEQLGAALR